MRKDKQKSTELRKKGLSYNEITKKLGVSKSTLSYWFRNDKELQKIKEINITEAKRKWAANITAYNKKRSIEARSRWVEMQNKSLKDVKEIDSKDLFIIGISLYWAEGYKKGNWNVIFSNADPDMNCIMMRFFTKICNVPKEKIRFQVQIHNLINGQKAIRYWAKKLVVSEKQFLKPVCQISKASKLKRGNSLPNGTLQIRINDVKLVNKIKGWIKGLIIKSGCSSVG